MRICDLLFEFFESSFGIGVIGQWEDPVSYDVGGSGISLEGDTDHDTEIRSGTFQRPQDVGFVLGTTGRCRNMLSGYTTDMNDLPRSNADHHGANNAIAGKSIKSGKMSDTTL